MASRGCPHCGKTIDAASRNCIHCDRDIYDATPEWFCTSCGAQTNPVSLSGFSFLIFLILCFIMLLPGILYALYWMVSGKTGCPECRKPTLIPIGSPVARAALAAQGPAPPRPVPTQLVRDGLCVNCQSPLAADAYWCPTCGYGKKTAVAR